MGVTIQSISMDSVRVALSYIPSSDRDMWLRIGMALKSEFADEAFTLFDQWSANAENYDAKAVKATWRSFKDLGGVTIATLIAEAKKNGFDPKQHIQVVSISPEEQAKRKEAYLIKQRAEVEKIAGQHNGVAAKALKIWESASDTGNSLYLNNKGVTAYGVRFSKDAVLLPLKDQTGKLWNLQYIHENGRKVFLKGGRVSACFHMLGDVTDADWLLIAEGYATAATLYEATHYPVLIAFNEGNMGHVAAAARELYPSLKLLLCADNDVDTEKKTGKNPGVLAAVSAAKKVKGYWCKPSELPEGGTDFNDMALFVGNDKVSLHINAVIDGIIHSKTKTKTVNLSQSTKPFFTVDDTGVWFHGFSQQGDALPAKWVCSELHVTARSRDTVNGEWGYLLEFKDADYNNKRWAMPASLLAGDGTEYRKTLLAMGLQIDSGTQAKNHLTTYIQKSETDDRVRCTDRIGWHDDMYVLPDRTIGEGEEKVMFQSASGVVSQFKQKGTLEDWQIGIASLCSGNSRLLFCVSAAFAAPLLHHAGVPSGGFHIWGDSSTGKSTAFKVAGSVYGGRDYPRNWRMTDNALEMVAAQHSDALLLLDEIAQVDPKVVGETVYMLANETGKGRATQTAMSRKVHTWRVLFLSDGEVSLANHMSEAGKGVKGGHDVRMAHIAADAGKGMGVYENLQGFPDGAALSNFLVNQSYVSYGVAGITFIEWVVEHIKDLASVLRDRVTALQYEICPADAHGQVARVAARFALVGVAGELATEAGITGWQQGEAIAAAKTRFNVWLDGRGGAGNVEHTAILRQVSGFFQAHGDARFTWWHRAMDDHKPNTINRAGLKRIKAPDGSPINSDKNHYESYGDKVHPIDAENSEVEYFVLPEVFRNEICKGFNHKSVSQLLIEKGLLIPEGKGDKARPDRKERLPSMGNIRCYRFTSQVVGFDQ